MPDKKPNIRKLKNEGDIDRLLEVQAQADRARDKRTSTQAMKAVVQLTKKDTGPLVEVVTDSLADEPIREAAATALGEIADPDSIGALVDALQDKQLQENTRETIVQALSNINDPKVMRALVNVLGDTAGSETGGHVDTGLVRETAAEILKKEGKKVIPYLVEVLAQRNRFQRQECVKLLDQLRWKPKNKEQSPQIAAYYVEKGEYENCVPMGEMAILPLMIELVNPDEAERQKIAEALGKIGPAAMKPLFKSLLDEWYYDIPTDRTVYHDGVERAFIAIGPPALKPLFSAYDKYDLDMYARGVLARVILALAPDPNHAQLEMIRLAAQYR